MKKYLTIILITSLYYCLLLTSSLAQAPQGFNYQGVARDNNGNILKSQTLGFRVSILADSTNGTAVYSESHTIVSNTNGVFELVVGQGTVVSGNFFVIDWGSTGHFLKTEMDAAGGTNYIFYGTTELMSVPYAMFAEKAGNIADPDSTNELQTLSFSNDTLYLSNGNFVILPDNIVDSDADSTNELQAISISNDTIYLSSGGFVILPSDQITGSSFNDEDFEIINATDYADAPATACNVSLAGLGAGNVENGTHNYKITFITQTGETMPGPASNAVIVIFNATDGKISLANIPVSSDNGVISRKIYRRFYGAGVEYKFVDTIPDNVTTTYIDSLDYFSLGDTLQSINTTKTKFVLDASSLNANRIIKVPDKSGTMALMSDLKADSTFLKDLIDTNSAIMANNAINISNNTAAINNDVDIDTTNEIQNLLLANDTLFITKGNSIPLSSFPGVPIGSIMAWAKNLTGVPALPDGFVECNGQVLNDSLSLLNGVTIPNLNASGGGTQRFLRGATTSGTTGGSESHQHLQTGGSYWVQATGDARDYPASHLPSYYEVVWIMRIK